MARKSMPRPLQIAVGLLVTGLAFSLAAQSWLAVCVQAALLIGLLRGSEGSRMILMGLAALGALSALAGLAGMFLSSSVAVDTIDVIRGAVNVAVPAFILWCLQRSDVQDWMFSRSMPLEE